MVFIDYPMFTIMVFNYCVIFYTIFVEFYHPMKSKKEQKKKILTEYVLLIVNYHLFCFTEWATYEQQ